MNKLNCVTPLVLVVLIFFGTPTQAQNSPVVRSLRARGADGVEINTWLAAGTFRNGKDLLVHYEVRNRGSKAIYLVHERISKISLIDSETTVLVQAPYPALEKYSPFDYSFLAVKRGKRLRGQIVIPRATINRDGPVPIRIAFGYVKNKSGLDSSREPNADAVLGGMLKSGIQIVSLGDLVVKND